MRQIPHSLALLISGLLMVATAGCGRDSVASTTFIPTAPTPPPVIATGPLVTVSGHVTDPAGSPVPAMVSVFPLRMSPAWSGPWGRGAQADASGRYQITNAPEHHDTVFVRAWKAGYVQQCATTVTLPTDASADLKLTPLANVLITGLPTSPDTRQVSGTVFEIRGNERRPTAGVWVGWEPIMDTVVAETHTDAQGRYRICGLSRERLEVFAVRPGVNPPRPIYGVVETGGDAVIDFELP
jgi:hypothetical protein